MRAATVPQAFQRQHFKTSRLLDFLSRKELTAQTGHQVSEWPLVCFKELVDNALDACEESGIAPNIKITVDDSGLTVADNGPGIPAKVVESVLDFTIRVSSREAYVSPCRGAQGNALKTVVAMPFALSGQGNVTVEAQGVRHDITLGVDRVRQEPIVNHRQSKSRVKQGTKITVEWSDSACLNVDDAKSRILQGDLDDDDCDPDDDNYDNDSGEPTTNDSASLILNATKSRFLQVADDYCWINPHLTLEVQWGSDRIKCAASDATWKKWLPCNPTDPHWYGVDDLERLIAAHICHNPEKTMREFVSEFRGLSGTAKQKKVLETVELSRARLSELIVGSAINKSLVESLLTAIKLETTPVKPPALGIIGRDHFAAPCEAVGGAMKSFNYRKVIGTDGKGLPQVTEACFAHRPEATSRRIIAGVNWSPGIINPFRQLGQYGKSLDSYLEAKRAGSDEPIVLVLHVASPKVTYADRGKSSVIVEC